jgi:hypothetical protein
VRGEGRSGNARVISPTYVGDRQQVTLRSLLWMILHLGETTPAAKRVVARAPAKSEERPVPQSPTVIRTYRIHLRDARNVLGRSHDVDLASDEAARDRARRILDEQTIYSYAEVWDRARLVCTVRKGE